MDDLQKIAKSLELQIKKLSVEKQILLKEKAPVEAVKAKDESIKALGKEKAVVDLTIQNEFLEIDNISLQRYLWASVIGILIAVLAIIALLQRKTIKVQVKELEKQLQVINKKNVYLEYAARLIRHDIHSGINTYIPRGLSTLQRRLQASDIEALKLSPALQLIQEGLAHTQRVYKNVYEFTNLVKVKTEFTKEEVHLTEAVTAFLSTTSYSHQVEIGDLGSATVNARLFCNAIDNLVRNGLKYNQNESKLVRIYKLETSIAIEDNGTGLSSEDFQRLVKEGVKAESETGLGLSITKAIIEEHGFTITCELTGNGTLIKIHLS
jgi:signal transduction histidine kinase